MNSQGMFSIGGIASGLDTATIITQLMQLERQPVIKLQSTQTKLKTVDAAWQQINTKLSALRTAVDGLARADRFAGLVTATSSDPTAVAVSKSSTAGTGSLSFQVTQLAASHQVASAPVAGGNLAAGTFTVAVGGQETTVELDGSTDLADLARRLNAAKGGFTASVVAAGDGTSRLIIGANATGLASTVQVTSDVAGVETGGFGTLQEARDAHVQLGSGAGAITLTRGSNTIDDLVPGATVTLKKLTDGPVTVTAARDVDGAVAAVKGYVEALNGAISTIANLSRYDAETKTAGALQGDPSARKLLADLRSAATAPVGVPLDGVSSAFQIGLSVDRNGAVTLDETKLKAALEADFDAVGRLLSRGGTASDPAARAVAGSAATAPGTYQVEVRTAARVAQVTGATYTPPGDDVQPKTLRIVTGGRTVEVTIDERYTTSSQAVQALNEALSVAGVSSLVASDEGGALRLSETRYGSANPFTVSVLGEDGEPLDPGVDDAWGLAGHHVGTDAAGVLLLGGEEIELRGAGRQLTVPRGVAEGLSFSWHSDVAGATTLSYHHGLVGGMSRTLATAEGSGGLVARARAGITNQIAVYQTRIDSFDVRLATREATLRRQFTAMESALASLNSQGSWLAAQLSSLNANTLL